MYDQNFRVVRDGGWGGGSSERCLKWGGGGSLKDLSKNILKQGVGKGKNLSIRGGYFEGVTTPASPRKNLIIYHAASLFISLSTTNLVRHKL